MSIAIGVLCIFTIVTLRDEYLMRQKQREYRELQAHYRPHEEASLLEEHTRR